MPVGDFMLLSTPATTSLLDVISTAPTVVQPGERVEVKIRIIAKNDCELLGLGWEAPKSLTQSSVAAGFPVVLQAGQTFNTQTIFITTAQTEDFGEMQAHLRARNGSGEEITVDWTAWISIFTRRKADDPEGLSDELRKRLLDVVNARVRNGHIFLANQVAFCDDFLNIEIPGSTASLISEDPIIEGLPVDPEQRLMIILGSLSFYGFEDIKLLAEEFCPESDDSFLHTDDREIDIEEAYHA